MLLSEAQKLMEKYKFDAPLQPGDTKTTTKGCRANDPTICSSNSIPGICAFTSDDGICKKPTRAWAKQYEKLKSK